MKYTSNVISNTTYTLVTTNSRKNQIEEKVLIFLLLRQCKISQKKKFNKSVQILVVVIEVIEIKRGLL